MALKGFISEIAALSKRYNLAHENVPANVLKKNPGFDDFTPESKVARLRDGHDGVLHDFAPSVARLQGEIDVAARALPAKIGKKKCPAVTSSDASERLVGELQLKSVSDFLAKNPDAGAIGIEARDCFALGRLDAFWRYVEHMRQSIPPGGPTTDEGRAMLAELNETLSNVDVSDVMELEREQAQFPVAQRAIAEFSRQVSLGRERVVLPEIWPLLSEEDRQKAMAYLETTGSLVERVSVRQRIAQAMGSELRLVS